MLELLRKRRSVRAYTQAPVDRQTIDLLVEALLRAPSSRGNNPCQFIVVDDRELLTQLATAKEHGSAFLKGAALGIVICADSTKSDVWVEDCSIAAILAQMAAVELGLGSCWIQIRKRRHDTETTAEGFVQHLLGLPEQVKVECIISIGHPDQIRAPLSFEKLEYAKVRYNGYAAPSARNGDS